MKTGYVILIAVIALFLGATLGMILGYKKASKKKKQEQEKPASPAPGTDTTETDEN